VNEPDRCGDDVRHRSGILRLLLPIPIRTAVSRGPKGDDGLRSSWFTGTVQLIDRKTRKTKEMLRLQGAA